MTNFVYAFAVKSYKCSKVIVAAEAERDLLRLSLLFLGASTYLYKRVCQLVGPSVGLLVLRFIFMAEYAKTINDCLIPGP